MSFVFERSRRGGLGVQLQYEGEPSTQFNAGAPCKFGTDGKLTPCSAQTDRPQAVNQASILTTAGGGEAPLVMDIGWTDSIWKAFITPKLNGVTAQTGGSTSTVIVLSDAAYSANDWVGGQVFIKELNMFATITASTSTSGASQNMTLTFTCAYVVGQKYQSGPPFAGTGQLLPKVPDGLTIYATPLGLNVAAAKLIATTFDTVSQVIADKTGGYIQIIEVVLSAYANPYVRCIFTT